VLNTKSISIYINTLGENLKSAGLADDLKERLDSVDNDSHIVATFNPEKARDLRDALLTEEEADADIRRKMLLGSAALAVATAATSNALRPGPAQNQAVAAGHALGPMGKNLMHYGLTGSTAGMLASPWVAAYGLDQKKPEYVKAGLIGYGASTATYTALALGNGYNPRTTGQLAALALTVPAGALAISSGVHLLKDYFAKKKIEN